MTRLVQPGDQVCTFAAPLSPLSNALHHGIVLSCSRTSIVVAHFQEEGISETELFGGFTNYTEVWLVDYWDAGQGLDLSVAPQQVTLDRINRELQHPNLQPRHSDSNFNSEHWATRKKADDDDFDGFCKRQYKCKEGRYVWVGV